VTEPCVATCRTVDGRGASPAGEGVRARSSPAGTVVGPACGSAAGSGVASPMSGPPDRSGVPGTTGARECERDSLGGVATAVDGRRCPVADPWPASPSTDAMERTGVSESITMPPRLGVPDRCDRRMRYACSSSVSGIVAMAPSNSAANSRASPWRTAGSLCKARENASWSAAGHGTSGRASIRDAGRFSSRARSTSPVPLPVNALCPVSARKAIRARA
jgi:hypothetical protein